MSYGIPQGSVRGPLLYVLYKADISRIVARHGLKIHQYADDIQIYISTSVGDAATAVYRLTACLADVEAWLRASRLQLNPTKTLVMRLGSSCQFARLDVPQVHVLSSSIPVQSTARDLGVVVSERCRRVRHWHSSL